MQVLVSGTYPDWVTEPAKSPITIQHLLTHTSGLTCALARRLVSSALFKN